MDTHQASRKGYLSPDAGIVDPNPPRFDWFPPQLPPRLIRAWSRRMALADVLNVIDQTEMIPKNDQEWMGTAIAHIRGEVGTQYQRADEEYKALALEYAESALRSGSMGAIFGLPDIRH